MDQLRFVHMNPGWIIVIMVVVQCAPEIWTLLNISFNKNLIHDYFAIFKWFVWNHDQSRLLEKKWCHSMKHPLCGGTKQIGEFLNLFCVVCLIKKIVIVKLFWGSILQYRCVKYFKLRFSWNLQFTVLLESLKMWFQIKCVYIFDKRSFIASLTGEVLQNSFSYTVSNSHFLTIYIFTKSVDLNQPTTVEDPGYYAEGTIRAAAVS